MSSTIKGCNTLRPLHQLISGLLISSAENGKLVDSLAITLKPIKVPPEEILDFRKKFPSLLLSGFYSTKDSGLEWCPDKVAILMKKKTKVTVLSGLAAFPLTKWPFIGDNPTLNSIDHFVNYIEQYHPNYKTDKLSDFSLMVELGKSKLVFYSEPKLNKLISFYRDDSILEITCFQKGQGTYSFQLKEKVNGAKSNSRSQFQQLSNLQYDGMLRCTEIDNSSTDKASIFLSFCNKELPKSHEIKNLNRLNKFLIDLEQENDFLELIASLVSEN